MKKAKKPLLPQLEGIVVSKCASLCMINDISSEEAFNKYMKGISSIKSRSKMKHYDIESKKEEILAKIDEKLGLIEKPKPTKKSVAKKKKFVAPEMMKIKGEVLLDKTDEGLLIRRTKKTKKIKLKCPEGSKGVMVDDDRAGCEIL